MSWISKKLKELKLPNFPTNLSSISIDLSNPVLIAILVIIAIFIFGGGVYDIMEKPISVLPTPQNPYFYYSGITEQTFTESQLFIVFLIMGVAGGFIAYRSTRHVYRPREAQMILVIGLALMMVAFLGVENIMTRKGL